LSWCLNEEKLEYAWTQAEQTVSGDETEEETSDEPKKDDVSASALSDPGNEFDIFDAA